MNKPGAASHEDAGHYGVFSVVRKRQDGVVRWASRGEAGRSPGCAQIATKTRGADDTDGKLWVGTVGLMRLEWVGRGRRG